MCSLNNSLVLQSAPSEGAPCKYEGPGPWSSVLKTTEQPVRFSPSGPGGEAECPARTLCQLFDTARQKRGDKIALRVEGPCPALVDGKAPPSQPEEGWRKWTYAEYHDECKAVAKGLLACGLQRFDAVAVFGFNSPEWFMSQMGAILAGGVAAGIYPTDTAEQVAFKIKHSGACVAVVEDEGKYQKVVAAAPDCPKLKAIVCWGCNPSAPRGVPEGVSVLTFAELQRKGAGVDDATLAARMEEQRPGHCCTYIYTSGTTGDPKAVMITHDNIIFESANVLSLVPRIGAAPEEERILSYLPLSHVAGLMVDIVSPLVCTATRPGWFMVTFARPYDLKVGSLGDRLRATRPTMFLGVPRVWEKVAEAMKKLGASVTGTKKKISTWAKAKGLAHQRNCQLGRSGAKPAFHGLAERLVLSKVKAALGLDACKFAFTGAAPIPVEILEYFGSLGIQINEVYGMSECTGATTWSLDEAHLWGSCGFTMPSCEVKILDGQGNECPAVTDLFAVTEAHQGEVCFRGRHIMLGYMANPDLGEEHVERIEGKTREAIDADGWLHSGDKGLKTDTGMLKITGRYKELIIGAGGENIAPVPIEDAVKKLCPAISNIMMVGDKRKFNVALVTLKTKGATGELPGTDNLDGAALDLAPGCTTVSAAMDNEAVIQAITDAVTRVNNDGTVCPINASKIQKFTILPLDFSSDTCELTPTFKLKRSVVEEKHREFVDRLLDSKGAYLKYTH